MEASHLAYNGHMDTSTDMAPMPLDFDAMMAPEHGLSHALTPFDACLHHESPCLSTNHDGHYGQFRLGDKVQHEHLSSLRPRSEQEQHGEQYQAQHQGQQQHKPPHDAPVDWDHLFAHSSLQSPSVHADSFALCNDADCASECSSICDGGCPSQCGDTGHGVCCDDDACGSPNLCLDEDCQGASRPCTDEKCLADTLADRDLIQSPAMTDGDKAAAAALASFGDNELHMVPAGFVQASSALQPLNRQASSSCLALPQSLPCGSLSMESMLQNASPPFSTQPFEIALEYTLANHIMQYHNPLHATAHTGTCVANDPSQLISRCTLPKFTHPGTSPDPYLPQFQSHECGFQVQDATTFAHHIWEEHKPALALHAHQPRIVGAVRPHADIVGPSLSATPSSLPTPSSMDLDSAALTQFGRLTRTQTPCNGPRAQVLIQQDQFLCRWLTTDDASICGLRFENDEQLQRHCKFDHLKHLKKFRGGFRCGWENCTRDTCFTQRSKVERHMQVHTGYKPVQCSICGAALSAKQALDQHMRIHTGETPWVCKFPGCNCAFKQQSALTMHERTHTGDKPLECEICHKRFSESSNLSKHRRTHNVKGLHECQLCGKDFHRLDQLRRHMGTNHKDRPAEVDALLSKAKTKLQLQKAFKLKKGRSRAQNVGEANMLNPGGLEPIGDEQLRRV
ncbi:hypothetical protein CDD81_2402 [Ophiocordyceps australis]|uniref:C2H2 type master regulator of conidiophore development brlA n=1 Tax=Ophiocordyceps australis TaxID=1399860 RepID=A0A2C5XWW9_9HYPO|nr:hypothetical protein CDD81_2402 [Ophiocordyceps australis]